MDQPDKLADGHVFMSDDEFKALAPGTKLMTSEGRVVFKMKEQAIHHTYDSVFDPSDGTVCHVSWFDGLQKRYKGKSC